MIWGEMSKNMTKLVWKKNIFFTSFLDSILYNSHLAFYKSTFYAHIPSTGQATANLPKLVGSYATKLKGVGRWSIWTPRFIFLTKPSAQSFLDAFLTPENIFELCTNIIFWLQKIIFWIWKKGPKHTIMSPWYQSKSQKIWLSWCEKKYFFLLLFWTLSYRTVIWLSINVLFMLIFLPQVKLQPISQNWLDLTQQN